MGRERQERGKKVGADPAGSGVDNLSELRRLSGGISDLPVCL